MPGKEAIEQIKNADKCSESDAIALLRAVVVGRVIPIRFQGRIVPKLPIGHRLGFYRGPGASPFTSVDWRWLLLTARFRADGMVKFSKTKWQPFEVRRTAIERHWPVGWVSTSAVEQKCTAWLIEDLKSRGASYVSKKERREEAIEKFDVSQTGFDRRIWPQVINAPGVEAKASRAGRKKKRNG